jgi:hypothetical protein
LSTNFFYIDESYDSTAFCLSALWIKHSNWRASFEMIKAHRLTLRDDKGISVRHEVHARDLVSGRGRLSKTAIGKWERSRIFLGMLKLAATLPSARLINICLPAGSTSDTQLAAWDRLLNRIERTMLEMERTEIPKRKTLIAKVRSAVSKEDCDEMEKRLLSYAPCAVLIADEGREHEIRTTLRRMHVFNPIPSQFGSWGAAGSTKNIPTRHVIEDPIFRRSADSYFLQVVDCVAFALLKKEVPPTPRIRKYGVDKMFEPTLGGICFKKASLGDPLGIVRK